MDVDEGEGDDVAMEVEKQYALSFNGVYALMRSKRPLRRTRRTTVTGEHVYAAIVRSCLSLTDRSPISSKAKAQSRVVKQIHAKAGPIAKRLGGRRAASKSKARLKRKDPATSQLGR